MSANNMSGSSSLPLFGYPGPMFETLHILALVCGSVSILSTIVVLVYMSCKNASGVRGFWRWLPGDRLVVYLAASDLGLNINHGLDHLITLVTRDHPVENLCAYFGFMLQLFQVRMIADTLYLHSVKIKNTPRVSRVVRKSAP